MLGYGKRAARPHHRPHFAGPDTIFLSPRTTCRRRPLSTARCERQQTETIKERIHEHLKEQGVFSSLKETSPPSSSNTGGSAEASAAIAARSQSALAGRDDRSRRCSLAAATTPAASHHHQRPPPPPQEDAAAGCPQGRALCRTIPPGRRPRRRRPPRTWRGGGGGGGGGGDAVCVSVHFGAQRPLGVVPMCAERSAMARSSSCPARRGSLAAARARRCPRGDVEHCAASARTPPMHVLVSAGRLRPRALVSSCMCEWRQVLHKASTLSWSCPAGADAAAGGLPRDEIEMPSVAPESRPTEAEVMMDLKPQRETRSRPTQVLAYARSWWAQFLDLSPAHQQRLKLFALSELGTRGPSPPSCSAPRIGLETQLPRTSSRCSPTRATTPRARRSRTCGTRATRRSRRPAARRRSTHCSCARCSSASASTPTSASAPTAAGRTSG